MPLSPEAKPPPPVIVLDEAGIASLADLLARRPAGPGRRAVLAIAGIPGSGKSTLAKAVAQHLNTAEPGSALVFPMDGFHLPNDTLEKIGLTDRKGAPETFDARGYIKMLTRLRDASRSVRVPIYERGLEEPVFTGKPEHTADTRTRYIVTEGNYLLLDMMPWDAVAPLADLTVLLNTPTDLAHQWIIERHVRFGRSPEAAEHWYQSNDLLNTRTILERSRHADHIARWPGT